MQALGVRALFVAAALSLSGAAFGQDYPSRLVKIVVPYPAGGVADRVARDLAADLQARLKQSVIVENKAGASGNIGFEFVARAPADGYTLLLAPSSNLTTQAALFSHLTYSLDKDFTPLSLLMKTPQVLLVHPGVQANSAKELAELSRRAPNTVNFGVSIGAFSHLASEAYKVESKGDFTPIPYQGTGPAQNDLLAGQVQAMFNDVGSALPHIQAGKVKALAVADRTRNAAIPNVPTMAEAGFPNIVAVSWYAVVVRAGTPKPIVDMLSKEINAIVTAPGFKARYEQVGMLAIGSTPEELASFMKTETEKWTAVVKQAGIQPQ